MSRKSCRHSPQRRARIALGSGLILSALNWAGCGPSSGVQDLPEAARESLARKKVDVQPRSSPASPNAPRSPKGATTGRRP
ncbi:MAG TPA: hypothetical protein VFF52_13675 [Isosphaeraceae bacterium]|nr:hypothetical protein [Isosphaeraceae bacterium]